MSYKTKYGKARVYSTGEGDCVWIVSGRDNAYQTKSLVAKLINYGYSCHVIEFVHDCTVNNASENRSSSSKHGRTSTQDKFVSIAQWTNVFDVLVKHLDKPVHVVAVGLGSSVVGNSRWITSYTDDLTLVSPILDLYKGLEHFFRQYTLPIYLLKRLAHEVYFSDKVHLRSLEVTKVYEQFKGNLSVYYSQTDNTSTVKAIRSLSESDKRNIVEFKGAKIEKIINSRSLFHTIQRKNQPLEVAV